MTNLDESADTPHQLRPRERQIVDRLTRVSREQAADLAGALELPERLDPAAPCMAPELVSLAGAGEHERLDEAQRRRLAFCEAVNFFSLNVHGEKYLVNGLCDRLYTRDFTDTSPYLHHFLDEENKHLYYFSQFCLRYAGKIYGHANLAFPRQYAPGEESFLFFVKVLLFEEVVDFYNVTTAGSGEVHPLAAEINRLHHRDEVRHLVFGRLIVEELYRRYRPRWSAETLEGVREAIAGFYDSMWRQYYNPAVYIDAGIDDPYRLAERVYDSEGARRHRRRASRKFMEHMLATNILTGALS